MKILIVDDSLLDRRLLIKCLQKFEITNEILEAGDGEQGLEIMQKEYQDICLIFLDWQMPKIDGIQFMRKVLENSEMAKVPIIMISASGGEENKDYVRQVNPQLAGYLVKPYDRHRLKELMMPLIK